MCGSVLLDLLLVDFGDADYRAISTEAKVLLLLG